jgi:predicted alpha/beta-fold hydrolase
MSSAFEPHPLCPGGQLQTVIAYFWPDSTPIKPDEQSIVPLSDGDAIVLDINHPPEPTPRTPIVYLMHGLGGDSDSTYKLRLASKLTKLGMRVIRHNHRGAGPHGKLARRIYHSGSVGDVLAGLQAVTERWPDSPVLVVGFSLSGTILLNLLGGNVKDIRELPQIKSALAVCPPIDLDLSSRTIDQFSNKHLDLFYVRGLLKQLLDRSVVDAEFVAKKMSRLSLRHFDEVITAPLAGFLNRDQYYDSCSPKHVVGNIRLPTLVLAAADDPIIPVSSVFRAPYSTKTLLSVQNSGGHLGFISKERTPQGDNRWLDYFVTTWVHEQLLACA